MLHLVRGVQAPGTHVRSDYPQTRHIGGRPSSHKATLIPQNKRQDTITTMIPCLYSFLLTVPSGAFSEPPVNKKRTRTLFRKESGSSTNCMVEHQGVEPWHQSPGLSHFDSLATTANCISQIWCQSMCNQLPLRLTSTPRRTKSAHSFSGWRT